MRGQNSGRACAVFQQARHTWLYKWTSGFGGKQSAQCKALDYRNPICIRLVMFPFAILVMKTGIQISLALLFLENCFLWLRDEVLNHYRPGHLLKTFLFGHILESLAKWKYWKYIKTSTANIFSDLLILSEVEGWTIKRFQNWEESQ